ncbi:MAG: addiction module antitoxin [Desulfobacteraceae bacterium 4572_88]|nr:MAG: addiction module antitoxin [Desulfobacteraceae bacterium 4572_88]
MYEIHILETAARDLKRTDRSAGCGIVKRIRWLASNLDNIRPQPLKENLSGLFKLRVGDYRIIYEILDDEKTIVIHFIGHRKDVYKKL